jgi:hypothetical protein
MPERSEPISREAERRELEAVAEALGRSSRLAHLLRYVGEKYFHGESGQLTEYNIATEVFGRSKATFDAGEDAIARVEAHRLRKRLKDYYKGAGKDRPIQVSIPLGTYIPSFTHGVPEPPSQTLTGVHPAPAAVSLLKQPRSWLFALLAAGLAVAAAAAFYAVILPHSRAAIATPTPPPPEAAWPPGAPPPAAVPLRILAGYSGEPQTDSAGEIWQSDRYVHGGGPWRRPEGPIARTSDPLLFQQWRTGDFTYDIPLRPGVYELHLYFITSDSSSEINSTFNIKINGGLVLSGFDINSDSLGDNIADERIFRDLSPAGDGRLHIAFASERGAPQLNALELLPGIPRKQLPIRLVMQRTSFTDHSGQFWHPDDYFMNGRLSDQRQQVVGSPDPGLFATERYGHFTYALPADPRDRYTLVLHFAEFYFGPGVSGGGGAGSRVFRVLCNGETLLDNFDIYKEAGSLHTLTETFYHLKPSAQGKLNLTFEPIVNNATVSSLEVLDESQ